MGHVDQPVLAPAALTEMISAHEANASDLHTVNRAIHESLVSWGLPERVRRLATPSLSYNETDLQHMTVILMTNAEGAGIAVAAWEEASSTEMPANARGVLLHGLYVIPHYQRRGLGTRLIELVAKRLTEQRMDGMSVRAWRDSIAFFLSRGFAPMDAECRPDIYPRRLWRAL